MIQWLALSLAIATVTWIAIWSRRPTRARGLAVMAMPVAIIMSGGLMLSQRGWATPILPYLTNLPEGEIVVHGARLIPEVAIYVWLEVDGEPRAFRLPWDAKSASQLQRAMEQGNGVKAKKRNSGRTDDDVPLEFHGNPQEPAPEKTPEQSQEYQRQ